MFGISPDIKLSRTTYKNRVPMIGDFNHGDFIPLDCFEVLPGDQHTLDLKSLIRMSTPIAPIFGDITMNIQAWFIPMRLVYDYTEELFGANKKTAGPVTDNHNISWHSIYSEGVPVGSISHRLGKPYTVKNSTKAAQGFGKVSILKERCYYLVWSEYVRAQTLQVPFQKSNDTDGVQTGDTYIGHFNGSYVYFNSMPLKVNKAFDYFTAATLNPQYSTSSVQLPLGTTAPVMLKNTAITGSGVIASGTELASQTGAAPQQSAPVGASGFVTSTAYADLSAATAATVNELRYAVSMQHYLERANYAGAEYFGILQAHYGVTNPDSRLQRPEYLGSTSFSINVAQVTAMADTTQQGAVKPAGSTGAVSVTGNHSLLFSKAFGEFGYILITGFTRTNGTKFYTQGLQREDTKFTRFDFYTPEFALIGDQEIKKKEIYLSGDLHDDQVFGYQEAWAEYRYRTGRATGVLDPAVPNALTYWSTSTSFDNLPELNSSFIQEPRKAVSHCLVTGDTGPDFIYEMEFDYTSTRLVRAHSIPGVNGNLGI